MAVDLQGINTAVYMPTFAKMINSLYTAKAYFAPVFGGQVQTKTDGVQFRDTAFNVKVNNDPVIFETYGQTDANGKLQYDSNGHLPTGPNVKFGDPHSIISVDTPVKYVWELPINELIQGAEANDDLERLIASRMKTLAEAWMRKYDAFAADYLSENAQITQPIKAPSFDQIPDTELISAFNALSVKYRDLELLSTPVAYVRQELYNAILASSQTVTGKGSGINIDAGVIQGYKGFNVVPVKSSLFDASTLGLVAVDDSAIQFTGFTGIELLQSQNHINGTLLHALTKGGEYMTDEAKQSVAKITLDTTTKS